MLRHRGRTDGEQADRPELDRRPESAALELARERLIAERNYWVLTVRRDGRTRPVWGVWLDETPLYLSIGSGGFPRAEKIEPGRLEVSIHVDSAIGVVNLEGIAERRNDRDERRRFAETHNAKYGPIMALEPTDPYGPFAILPRVAYGWRSVPDSDPPAEDVKTATKWTFPAVRRAPDGRADSIPGS